MVASITLGQRIEKSADHPYGWKEVSAIAPNEVCVLYLGGDGALEDRIANGYAKTVEREIAEDLPQKVSYYSVKYDFAGHSKEIARKLNFLKHRATALASKSTKYFIEVQASEYTLNPQYIDTLYQATLAPRISTCGGKEKLPAEEAARNVRKMTIVAHCHGGYVAHMLEKKMRAHMQELGYSPQENLLITSQMLVVAHAPSCPLGVQKSSFYSFRSAYDPEGETGWNLLPEYIRKRKKEERFRFNGEETHDAEKIKQNRWFDLPASYLEKKRLFLIKQKHPWLNDEGPFMVNPAEHGDISCGSEGQTKDGTMLLLFSRNVVLNGVINSLQQKDKFTPLPPIDKLILESGNSENSADRKQYNEKITAIFKQLKESGKSLIKEIIADYRQSNSRN